MIEYDRHVEVYNSENIESISYSLESRTMKVRFTTTATYVYYGVEPDIFATVIISKDIGKMFYAVVSSKPDTYPYERIDI